MSDSPSHAFPSPEELAAWLPAYEIQSCIHAGHTSAIYLARQSALERMVVIRIMPEPEPAFVPLLLERLRRRARLVDPRIVSVFDFGRTVAGPLYLVTEHVDGSVLESLIAEQQVTPKHAFQLANELCDAVQMIHDLHIVHGALSCQTVLVTRDWHLKVTGIGMSETAQGELSWMEESDATFTDDIHALGCVIHAMFSGNLPTDDGKASSSLPAAFARTLERCLVEDLEQRYSSPKEVRTALAEALRTEKRANTPATKTVIARGMGGHPPTIIPPRSAVASPAPLKPAPGRPIQRTAPPPPTFFQRLDAFFWSTVRTSLHLMIIGGTALLLGALFLFKDHIIFEDSDEAGGGAAPLPAKAFATLAPREARYMAALQREMTSAREEKRGGDVEALAHEIQRLQDGGGIPFQAEADLSPAIIRLRADSQKMP